MLRKKVIGKMKYRTCLDFRRRQFLDSVKLENSLIQKFDTLESESTTSQNIQLRTLPIQPRFPKDTNFLSTGFASPFTFPSSSLLKARLAEAKHTQIVSNSFRRVKYFIILNIQNIVLGVILDKSTSFSSDSTSLCVDTKIRVCKIMWNLRIISRAEIIYEINLWRGLHSHRRIIKAMITLFSKLAFFCSCWEVWLDVLRFTFSTKLTSVASNSFETMFRATTTTTTTLSVIKLMETQPALLCELRDGVQKGVQAGGGENGQTSGRQSIEIRGATGSVESREIPPTRTPWKIIKFPGNLLSVHF